MRRLLRFGMVIIGAGIVLFALLAYGYYHDAKQLAEFIDRAAADEMTLRAFRICLDMQTHPEKWQGSSLKPPCEYDVHTLRYQIRDYEIAMERWDRVIAEREALLKARREGPFGFLERQFDPYGP